MESKKTKTKLSFSFPLSDNINRKIAFLEVQLFFLLFFWSSFSVCLSISLSIYLPIHPRTHLQSIVWIPKTSGASKYIYLLRNIGGLIYTLIKDTSDCLRAPLYWRFEGADKNVWQLLKGFRYDKELHYVTIKSKTLICHFNQNTPVRSFANPSIHPSIDLYWVRNDQNGYEMTKKGKKWLGYELTTI